jgi:hypothetical protein
MASQPSGNFPSAACNPRSAETFGSGCWMLDPGTRIARPSPDLGLCLEGQSAESISASSGSGALPAERVGHHPDVPHAKAGAAVPPGLAVQLGKERGNAPQFSGRCRPLAGALPRGGPDGSDYPGATRLPAAASRSRVARQARPRPLLFRYRGRYGTVARSRDAGLHGRKAVYRSVRQLVLSYADPYVDGSGRITGYGCLTCGRFAARTGDCPRKRLGGRAGVDQEPSQDPEDVRPPLPGHAPAVSRLPGEAPDRPATFYANRQEWM